MIIDELLKCNYFINKVEIQLLWSQSKLDHEWGQRGRPMKMPSFHEYGINEIYVS